MIKKTVFILCFLFGIFTISKAQNYNFQYLTIQKGLPQSQVFAICFDVNDYAWIGTQGGGVAIYNGEGYKYLTQQDSLISNRVYDIKEIDSKIWVACKGGVSNFDLKGGFIKNYRFESSSILAQNIIEFESAIYIGSNVGVYELLDEKLKLSTKNPILKSLNVKSFYVDLDNELWINSSTGIYNLDDPLRKLNRNRGLLSDYVTSSVLISQSRLIGMYGGGVQLYDRKNGIELPKALEKLKKEIVLDVLVNDNEVWIGTMNNGVYVWNTQNNELKNFNVDNGLSNNHVKKIVKDKWGNIWLGTSGGGVSIYNNSPFLEYNKTNGLNSNYIYAVVKDHANNLWVSTEGTGVVRLNDTSTVLFDEEYGYAAVKTRALFEDNEHNIWFGSEGQGLGIWLANDGKDTVYRYKNKAGLHNNWIKCFAQNPKTNQVFFGTSEGLYYVSGQSKGSVSGLTLNRVSKNEIPNRLSDICFDKHGVLYFSSNVGVGKVVERENKWNVTMLTETEQQFRNILVKDSLLFSGSADNGVLRINLNDKKDKLWFTTKDWLNSDNVYQLTYNNKALWVGTEKGLVKLEMDSINKVKTNTVFQYEDGFEGVETNVNASFVDRDKHLWFGTTNGLFLYSGSSSNKAQKQLPTFRLTDIQIFYESILNTSYARFFNHIHPDSVLVLPYDQNHIGFNLEAIHYSYSKKIRYRWMLDGADKSWSPPTKNSNATFGSLKAGKYTFMAQVSIDDTWDSDPITYKFVVESPFWDTFWFKTSYILGSIVFGGLIILIIYRRFKRKNKLLREKLEVERSLLDLEQKALRLQMNPHFIFNSLNSIHNLIILNDSAKARYALSKFSKLMRMVLENSREKLISIDDEVETLENYVQLEKLTTHIEFDFKIEIDEELDTNEPLLPPLMIQPFIENAIIHGFKNIMHQGMITVSFKLINDNILQCTIDDNGIGRANASEINAQKENYHKSTALQVTQERLSNINSKPNFSPFQIIDKKDKEGYCTGTTIVIQVEI